MKIKILDPGYEKLNGYFGTVLFKDGVSVNDVSPAEIQTMAAVVTVVDAKTDKQLGVNQIFLDSANQSASVPVYKTRAQLRAEGKLPASSVAKPKVEPRGAYTREMLEAIADSKGIAGLREIGDQFGARGRGISTLIDDILRRQPAVAADTPADTATPNEGESSGQGAEGASDAADQDAESEDQE